MFATQAPGSPPELTSSKSSKSSSYRSSSFSGPDGILSDLSHFEDIGLEDEAPIDQDLYGYDSGKRPSLRPGSSNTSASRAVTPGSAGLRELTNGPSRPTYPSLQGQVRHASTFTSSLSLNPIVNGWSKHRVSSPSSPSLAMTAMRNQSRSRSPSPTHPQTFTASPRSIATGNTLLPSPSLSIPKRPSSRRSSMQTARKTPKVLEGECGDSDEDLPDDASLWNVPLSPGFHRSASAASSAKTSPNGSPERLGQGRPPLPAGMSSIRPLRTAPIDIGPHHTTRENLPSSPVKPRLPRGASTSVMPDHFGLPKTRAKSWTAALSELSEEAKTLTEALEEHAIEADRRHEEKIQRGVASARPSMEKLARSKTTIVELPPLRKSNVMIDPLPISKEKEKVLSRTRPSWLPPKSRKEEKKHLKEYQKMMELSLEADKKRAAKAATDQCVHDDTKATLGRIWDEHVLPNWEQAVREPRTRELFWRGIAPRSRAAVWQRAIGNELALTEATYMKALRRSQDTEKAVFALKDETSKEKAWFSAIRRDVDSTFPDLKMFQSGGPLHNSLSDVLKAYSMYRSDVGHSHGTNLPAALLLLSTPTPSVAFILLANLLNRPLPLAFLTADNSGIWRTYTLILNLLEHKSPKLFGHLFGPMVEGGLGLHPEHVFEPMIRTMFLQGCCSTSNPGTMAPSAPSSNNGDNITRSSSQPPNLVRSPGAPLSAGSASSASTLTTPTTEPGIPSSKGLSLETASRIWDVIVFDGDAMIIRTCVGILACLESKLYGSTEEVLAVLGWEAKGAGGFGPGMGWGEEEIMRKIRSAGKEAAKA
ncbi:hypothetical protein MMC09_005234 [Bachmanniomyces sp. S44760]|nr:hypothetical protein [Bachmanniomyces sp. S44760]